MKQTMIFAAFQLGISQKPYRRTSMAIMILFMLVISVGAAKSQSKDQINPTPLTSNVVSDTLSPNKKGDKYYYSFVAGPGDVTVTLTVEAEKGSNNYVQAGLALFDEREVQLGAYKNAGATSGYSDQAVENVSLKRRQRVLVLISVTQYSTGYGKYRMRISGAVESSQNKSTTVSEDIDPLLDATGASIRSGRQSEEGKTGNLECLPKQGTLIVKMKDGSKKIIDLSEAETVTIVP